MSLKTPLSEALRTTPAHLKKLSEMGVRTVTDLLHYVPRALEEMDGVASLADVQLGVKQTFSGQITDIRNQRTPRGKTLYKATLHLPSGEAISAVWFRAPYQLRTLPEGAAVELVGPVKRQYGALQIVNPELNKSAAGAGSGLRPVYVESPPITSRWLREKLKTLLPYASQLPDILPPAVISQHKTMPLGHAISTLHKPENGSQWQAARAAVGFRELFGLQLRVLWQRALREHGAVSRYRYSFDAEAIKSDIAALPFSLTFAQKRTLFEVLKDFEKEVPMSRLVQGDVGAGKTVVALLAAKSALRQGWQAALMAPTEILAQQHFATVTQFFGAEVRVELLTGSVKESEKKRIRAGLANGSVQLVVGTHALLTDTTEFHSLALAVIDEQHRFGVAQREVLRATGAHTLNMSATPIPRTLALTLYGDQDLSIIDEKPAGRKPPVTRVVADAKTRRLAHAFIDDQIGKGRQIFWICPLVEVSEKLEATSVIEHFAHVSNDLFPTRRVLMLHGQMKPAEKEKIMAAFQAHEADILVATSVIEVGVDIPNATAMVIENAERFGLSQLHQFRGRIGRNDMQSYCFLMVSKPEQKQKERLRAMEQSADGFYLSEVDLKLRGAGELYGLRQSGIPPLKCAEITDTVTMHAARAAAEDLLARDPTLAESPAARAYLDRNPVYTS